VATGSSRDERRRREATGRPDRPDEACCTPCLAPALGRPADAALHPRAIRKFPTRREKIRETLSCCSRRSAAGTRRTVQPLRQASTGSGRWRLLGQPHPATGLLGSAPISRSCRHRRRGREWRSTVTLAGRPRPGRLAATQASLSRVQTPSYGPWKDRVYPDVTAAQLVRDRN